MTFAYSSGYIGPYCVSEARGKSGDIQKFRIPTQTPSKDHIAQGLMITEGRILASWSTGQEFDSEMGIGNSFALDQPVRPLAINEEMVLRALSDCAFLCVTAVGIQQKVHHERYRLSANERLVIDRYTLVAVAGPDSVIRVNDSEPKKGCRIIYARSTELEIVCETPSMIGTFSFRG